MVGTYFLALTPYLNLVAMPAIDALIIGFFLKNKDLFIDKKGFEEVWSLPLSCLFLTFISYHYALPKLWVGGSLYFSALMVVNIALFALWCLGYIVFTFKKSA